MTKPDLFCTCQSVNHYVQCKSESTVSSQITVVMIVNFEKPPFLEVTHPFYLDMLFKKKILKPTLFGILPTFKTHPF